MAKKKNNPTVVNNIESVNLDIDCDKLAEAIVKAQKEANEKHSVSSEMMKFIIVPTLWILALVCGFIGLVFFAMLIKDASVLPESLKNQEYVQWIIVFIEFIVSMFSFGLAFFSGFSAKEMDEEKDRQYVASVFSNIIALVALIVALIALVKGVG